MEFHEEDIASGEGTEPFMLAEVLASGVDRTGERHGANYVRTAPGYRLKLKEFLDARNEKGRKLEIITEDDPEAENYTGLEVHSHMQFYDGISVIRSWTEVINKGMEDCGLEYVSSFALTGIEKEGMQTSDEKLELRIPHNAWQKELHWNSYRMTDRSTPKHSRKTRTQYSIITRN